MPLASSSGRRAVLRSAPRPAAAARPPIPRQAMDARGDASRSSPRTPRRAAARRTGRRAGPRLRARAATGAAKRRGARRARGFAVSRAAPPRARRVRRQRVAHGRRPPPPRLPAHAIRPARRLGVARGVAGVLQRGRAGPRVSRLAPIEAYLAELEAALHVRGRVRRRFVRECGDHLADAAAARGGEAAVRAFGPPADVAAAFDAEVAARRAVDATAAAVLGVLGTGGSTLALIHAAAPDAVAPTGWAITFFVAAQVAAVAAALALVQALVLRRDAMSPPALRLLARRNALALVAAGLTMFAAGAALPGHGSAALLLAGPLLVCVALGAVLRARSLARRLDVTGLAVARPPLADLRRLIPVPVPELGPGR